MKKQGIVIALSLAAGLVLFGPRAHAEDTKVTSVFDDAAFRVGITLPFVVNAVSTNKSASLVDLGVEGATTADQIAAASCNVAKDPFVRANFLLKCTKEVTVRIAIKVNDGSGTYGFKYGPVEIKVLKQGYTVPTDPSKPGTDPEIAVGKALIMNTGCTSCHNSPQTNSLRDSAIRSPAILSKLTSYGGMTPKVTSNVRDFSTEEARKIVKYLKSISDPEVWP